MLPSWSWLAAAMALAISGVVLIPKHEVTLLSTTSVSQTATPDSFACPVTKLNGPAGESEYKNEFLTVGLYPDGTVVFKPGGPGSVEEDGSLDMKFWWTRFIKGQLTIDGHRLDGSAPPLRAHIPQGYGDTGFQATGLIFPTPGCWEVTGHVGNGHLTFVTLVVKIGDGPKPPRLYWAPDSSARVAVVPVSKEPGRSEYESRIVFWSSDDKVSCTLDYSSDDSEHGFGVVKAEWTPDSQYFVFSLASSGGHQAWHAPTQFLSRNDSTIRSLDDYFAAAGISKSDFLLIAPDTVKTEVWEGKSVPVSVELAVLPPLRLGMSKPLLINCVGGHAFKPD